MAVWATRGLFRRFGSFQGPEKPFFRRFDLFLAPVRRLDRPLFPAYHGNQRNVPLSAKDKMTKIARIAWLSLPLLYGLIAYLWAQFVVCAYESSDRGWNDCDAPYKGATLDGIIRSFDSYVSEKHALNTELCRTTEKHWINPFLWPDYLLGKRWHLAYLPPTDMNVLHQRNIEKILHGIQQVDPARPPKGAGIPQSVTAEERR